ncbi:MAG: GNAT family N-acetyltransferase [Nitrososphaerales archaeon]
MPETNLGPCTIEDSHVRLEPLKIAHAEALLEAGMGIDWSWISLDLSSLESMKKWINITLSAQERGEEYPFMVYLKSQNRVIGSTRYMDVQSENKGVEIGGTWYSPSEWGTCKPGMQVSSPEACLRGLERNPRDVKDRCQKHPLSAGHSKIRSKV